MVELIGLLKGLHSALHQAEGDPEIMIRRALHEQTQHFIHSVMGPPTRKAVKYQKGSELKANLKAEGEAVVARRAELAPQLAEKLRVMKLKREEAEVEQQRLKAIAEEERQGAIAEAKRIAEEKKRERKAAEAAKKAEIDAKAQAKRKAVANAK